MYTEAMLYTFAHAVRATDLTTVQLMRRLDTAVANGHFDGCTWGNMSQMGVTQMVQLFVADYCQ